MWLLGLIFQEKHIEAQVTGLSFDVKSVNNGSLRHSYFFLPKSLTKQIKSSMLCFEKKKIDDTEPLKH